MSRDLKIKDLAERDENGNLLSRSEIAKRKEEMKEPKKSIAEKLKDTLTSSESKSLREGLKEALKEESEDKVESEESEEEVEEVIKPMKEPFVTTAFVDAPIKENKVKKELLVASSMDYYEEEPRYTLKESLKSKINSIKDGTFDYGKLVKHPITIVIGTLLITYVGGVYYYTNHFLPNTTINGLDLSNKDYTVSEASVNYGLNEKIQLVVYGGNIIELKHNDIGGRYETKKELEKVYKEQSEWKWITSYFDDYDKEIYPTYNKDELVIKLKELLPELTFPETTRENVSLSGTRFTIEEETVTNVWDYEKVAERIIESKETKIDVSNAHKAPDLSIDSETMSTIKLEADKLINNKVTYDILGNKEKVPVTYEWLTYTDGKIGIDEDYVISFLRELSGKYQTLYTSREFKTISGEVVTVPSGSYGWYFDVDTEYPILTEKLLKGEEVELIPNIIGSGYKAEDIGTKYIEVSLADQHMWYIEDGVVLLETDIVTGKNSSPTPRGVDHVWSKERYKTLVGPNGDGTNYASEVEYWMAINWLGVGIHDAYWQSAYGGERYLTNGSHGCLNTPLDMVESLYNMVDIGTPVIVY